MRSAALRLCSFWLLALAGCGASSSDGRPPYLLLRLVVPESFHVTQVASAEAVFTPEPGESVPFHDATGLFEVNGVLTTIRTQDQDADGPRELLDICKGRDRHS
jgi:hypothetical protein